MNDNTLNDELLFRVLTGRANSTEVESVRTWRNRSKENERHYQEVAEILDLASLAEQDAVDSTPPGMAAVLARTDRQTHQWSRVLNSRFPVSERRFADLRLHVAFAAAAVLVLLVGTSNFFLGRSVPDARIAADTHDFVTGPHETASVVLGDGTVIRLGSDSRLKVPNHTTAREVSISGRAYFAVARDEGRPFVVRTPEGTIRVLGTRFSLEAFGEDLRLVVIEGQVALSGSREEIELHENQMARVIRGNALPVITVADPSGAAEWVGDFLAFQDTPLRDVIHEVSRKYDVRIELSEPELAERTLTAWFAGYTLEQVVEVICIITSSECEIEDSLVTIRPQL